LKYHITFVYPNPQNPIALISASSETMQIALKVRFGSKDSILNFHFQRIAILFGFIMPVVHFLRPDCFGYPMQIPDLVDVYLERFMV